MKDASFFIYNKYQFTPFQQKVIMAILVKLFYTKKQLPSSFSIKAQDIIKDINVRMTYEEIQKETLALLHKTYHIEERERLLQTSIFSNVEFVKGKGIINISLTSAFIPYLQGLKKQYSLLAIQDLIGFQSIYATKMYLMFLAQDKRSPIFKISITDLKASFGILHQYKDYNTFKNRVILQAQKELHFTHLAFTFQEIKEGRKVTHFLFKMIDAKHLPLNKKQKELAKKLVKELEVTSNQAHHIVVKFLPEEIHQIIFSIKERYHSGQIKSSLGAYTLGVFSHLSK